MNSAANLKYSMKKELISTGHKGYDFFASFYEYKTILKYSVIQLVLIG